jgi:catechol 2,3-dioxygenase-like lactoylglutathione lyase family enzyme
MRLYSAVLITRDIARLRRFYEEVLGLHLQDDYGTCVVYREGVSLWQPAAAHVVKPSALQQTGHPFELCFEAETEAEFETLAESFVKHGASLLHGVQLESWGQRTVRLMDPDGNLVEWGESVSCFVQRLASEGNDAEAIAAKTGVQVDVVRHVLSMSAAAEARG